MKNTDGFHIYGWMVNDLALQGGDLLAFALVFSFTKGHAGEYVGNTAYLSGWTGWTEKTARAHLANLVEKGLIVEVRGRDNNCPFCHYKLAPDFYEKHPVKITASPGKNYPVKISESTRKKLPQEYNSSIEENSKKETPFIPPTPNEVADYVRGRGYADPEGFANLFVSLCTAYNWRKKKGKGEPIDNWKLYIIGAWEENNKQKKWSSSSTPSTDALTPTTFKYFGL